MRLRPGLRPGPHWGSSRPFPRPSSRLGGDTLPHIPPSRRLDPRTFGARQSATATPTFLTNRTLRLWRLDRGPHQPGGPRAPKHIKTALYTPFPTSGLPPLPFLYNQLGVCGSAECVLRQWGPERSTQLKMNFMYFEMQKNRFSGKIL